jgi:hypothetical protein
VRLRGRSDNEAPPVPVPSIGWTPGATRAGLATTPSGTTRARNPSLVQGRPQAAGPAMPPPSAVAGPAPSGPWCREVCRGRSGTSRSGSVPSIAGCARMVSRQSGTTAGWRGRQAEGALDLFGAPGRIRTCDLPLRRRLLYPLSYEGGGNERKVKRTRPPELPGWSRGRDVAADPSLADSRGALSRPDEVRVGPALGKWGTPSWPDGLCVGPAQVV